MSSASPFQALADPTRRAILKQLRRGSRSALSSAASDGRVELRLPVRQPFAAHQVLA